MSIMFVIPLMLHNINGLTTETIGIIMFPGAFSAVIFGRVAGNMTVKRESHFVMYLGLSLITISLQLQFSYIGQWVWLSELLLF
jgi:MFS transporter, DHA2 family, metal-tetracycline-proton antiporter